MMFCQTSYLASGHQIAAIEIGNASDADLSIMFLHGWLDNAASFLTVMSSLAEMDDRVHLCAIDLPGHGLSEHKSADSFYSFHDYMDDLHQILVTHPAKRVILVGHSLGGLIASCYSAAFPEQVSDIVLIEAIGPLAESPESCVERLRTGVLSRDRLRKKLVKGYESLSVALMVRAQYTRLPETVIQPIVERGIVQQNGQWQWRVDPKLTSQSLYRMSAPHVQVILRAIQCPAVVILGTAGYPELNQAHRPALPANIQIQTISGGHHCHMEHPQEAALMIMQVVAKRRNDQKEMEKISLL